MHRETVFNDSVASDLLKINTEKNMMHTMLDCEVGRGHFWDKYAINVSLLLLKLID